MSKILFTDPSIFRGSIATPVPDPTPIVVPGSAQGGVDPYAMSYGDWMEGYAQNYDEIDGIDQNDYVAWWKSMMNAGYAGFTSEAFNALNPGWSGPSPFGN